MQLQNEPDLNLTSLRLRGRLPNAVERWVMRYAGMGLDLWLLPDANRALDRVSTMTWLPHLGILDDAVLDFRRAGVLPHLRSLTLQTRGERRVDPDQVPVLERFWGNANRARYLLDTPNLRFAGLVEWGDMDLTTVAAPLERFEVVGARHLRALPEFAMPERMHTLEFSLMPRIDLGRMAEMSALRSLTLHGIGEITGIEALLDLPRLENVFIENCPTIHGVEALAKLTRGRVHVIGRNAFGEAFRTSVSDSDEWWDFPAIVPVRTRGEDRIVPAGPRSWHQIRALLAAGESIGVRTADSDSVAVIVVPFTGEGAGELEAEVLTDHRGETHLGIDNGQTFVVDAPEFRALFPERPILLSTADRDRLTERLH
ncbi:hypothetical protein [Mycetocola saprophilus]|uniref:hypothetical protein n=1 Tax=Mycetocola saprophilus TaxID=76636 RepID=UPI003BF27BE7